MIIIWCYFEAHTCTIYQGFEHDKTNKISCALIEDSDQPGQSLRFSDEEAMGPWIPTELTAKALIRLGKFQVDLSLLWAHRSFCWFCHVAAHIPLKICKAPVSANSLSKLSRLMTKPTMWPVRPAKTQIRPV